MPIKKITTAKVAEPEGGIYSQCLIAGDQLFIAGQTAQGLDGKPVGGDDMYQQSRECLRKIRDLLEAAGSSLSDVVKMTVYVTDMRERPAFGRARSEFFSEPRPCSTMLEISHLAGEAFKVEVDVTAVRGASKG